MRKAVFRQFFGFDRIRISLGFDADYNNVRIIRV